MQFLIFELGLPSLFSLGSNCKTSSRSELEGIEINILPVDSPAPQAMEMQSISALGNARFSPHSQHRCRIRLGFKFVKT